MEKGILYICSTAVNGLVKIGITTKFEERMRLLENNGYRNVTGLKRQFAIEIDNYDAIELLLQRLLSRSRIGDSELFAIDINDAICLFSALRGTQVYPKNSSQEEVANNSADILRNSILPDGIYTTSFVRVSDKFKSKGTMKVKNGNVILLKGAVCADMADSADSSLKNKIRTLSIENHILMEDVNDISVSQAAGIVAGINKNGWNCWKDKNNNKIDKYRQELKEGN